MEKLNPIESTPAPADPEAWLEAYGDYLFRYAVTRVGNRELAEDLVQDTLLAAYRKFSTFEGRSSVKTWLVTILRNNIIDHFRRSGRMEIVGLDDSEAVEQHFNKFGLWRRILGGWQTDPDELLQQKELGKVIAGCLGGLPSKMHQVFVLRVLENQSTEEISKVLNITPNNVWVRLHQSRLQLRSCLETKWFANPAERVN